MMGPTSSADSLAGPTDGGKGHESASSRRAGMPAPAGSFDGRARSFREEQEKNRSAKRERIGVILVVAIIVLGVFAIVTARPFSPSSNGGLPTPGPPITVRFGAPSVSTVNCSAGGKAYVEQIPWTNSSEPITTGDINLRVYEIWDGDYIGDRNVVANATPSNLCAGSPPGPLSLWYAVLQAPNGTNLLTYTVAQLWTSLSGGAWNIWVQDGFVLVLVTYVSLAGTGRGIAVYGHSGGSPIQGSIPL